MAYRVIYLDHNGHDEFSPRSPKDGVSSLLEALFRPKGKRSDFILEIVDDGPNMSKYEELVHKLDLADVVCFYDLKTKQDFA